MQCSRAARPFIIGTRGRAAKEPKSSHLNVASFYCLCSSCRLMRPRPRKERSPLAPRTGRSPTEPSFGHMGRCRTDSNVVVVDPVTVDVHVAVGVHVGGIRRIIARRAQPPVAAVTTTSLGYNFPSPSSLDASGRENRFLSLLIQAPSMFWQSALKRAICSYCLSNMHLHSIAKRPM